MIALGNAYVGAGQTREAVRTFTHLLAIDPANGLAHENIGIAELSARNYPAAEASLRRAVSLNPNLAGAYTALGVVLASTDRRDEAIGVWKRAVDLDAQETDALFNLTVNLAAAGRRDEARLYGERYLAIVPPQVKDAQTIRQILDKTEIGQGQGPMRLKLSIHNTEATVPSRRTRLLGFNPQSPCAPCSRCSPC